MDDGQVKLLSSEAAVKASVKSAMKVIVYRPETR